MPKTFKAAEHVLDHLADLPPYVPGLQPSEQSWVKLNTNENPFPPSPKVAKAIRQELRNNGHRLCLYPNPTSSALRSALATHHGVNPRNVIVGNGSDDILNLLFRCFSSRDRRAGFTVPSYSLYPVLARAQNARYTALEFDRTFALDPDKVVHSKANVFFLTSPNAPTGVSFAPKTISTILENFSGLLVVDEAYAAFANTDVTPLLSKYTNLCIVRTFSKSHGLAGLRVGYALAHPEIIKALDTIRDSYNVNGLAQVGALAALQDPGYYQATIKKIIHIRGNCRTECAKRGWFTYDSQANFIFTEPINSKGQRGPEVSQALFEYLKKRKILVRYFQGHPLTNTFLRITVGNEYSMQKLSKGINAWLQNA